MNYKSIAKWGVMVFAVIAFAATNMTAQKIGHMNSQLVFTEMPATKSAKSSMEDFSKQLNSDYVAKEEKLQKKVADAEKRYAEGNMTPKELEAVRAEIQKQLGALEQDRQRFQQQLIEKEEKLMQPLVTKFTDAIKSVATENGYDFIIDSTALLYAEDADDVTDKVKAKLSM